MKQIDDGLVYGYFVLESTSTRMFAKIKKILMNDELSIEKRLDFIHQVEEICDKERDLK